MLRLGPEDFAAFIALLGILIFVHELGHFLVAKAFDIKVTKFSLGFWRPLVSFTWGETTYQIAAIPLGGYVKMAGDNPYEEVDSKDRDRAFTTAPIYQRALVAAAGPTANFILPVICFFAYNVLGPEVLAPEVGGIEPGTPAARAGLKPGDRFLSVDGHRVWSFERLQELIQDRPGVPVQLEVEREGEQVAVDLTTDVKTIRGDFGSKRDIGVIGVANSRNGTRIGIIDSKRAPSGLETGDQVLTVDGQRVVDINELESALRSRAGKTVPIEVARTVPVEVGALLSGEETSPVSLSLSIPESYQELAALGLASSELFVRNVVPGSPADKAGIRPGDQVVTVDGKPVRHFWAVHAALDRAEGKATELGLRRDGAVKTVRLATEPVPCFDEMKGENETRSLAGFGVRPAGKPVPTCVSLMLGEQTAAHWSSLAPLRLETPDLSLGEAAVEAVRLTVEVMALTVTGLYKMFSFQISSRNLGGPLSILGVTAQVADQGILPSLQLLALLSVNIGLINLLPIPILDGGHLLFCGIEAIRRKPLSVKAREFASMVGLLVLLGVFILAMSNDLLRLEKILF